MTRRDDCTQCQEWELCPFHPAEPAAAPATAAATPASTQERISAKALGLHLGRPGPAARGGAPAPAPSVVVPTDWRYLGLDDPEVLGPDTPPDLIYAVPGGGVVGVPQSLAAAANMGVFR